MIAILDHAEAATAAFNRQLIVPIPGKKRSKLKQELQTRMNEIHEVATRATYEFLVDLFNEKKAFLGERETTQLIDKCGQIIDSIRTLNERLPGSFDICEAVYNDIWQFRYILANYPHLDQKEITKSREYFDSGGQGVDVRDILDGLPG